MTKTTKICNICGIKRDLSEFYKHVNKKDGLTTKCKNCYKQYYKENKDKKRDYDKKYRQTHKKAIDSYNKKYRELHREEICKNVQNYYKKHKKERIEYNKKYRQKNKEGIKLYNKKYKQENRERISQQEKKYRQENKEKIFIYNKQYKRKRYQTDLTYKLSCILRKRVRRAIKNQSSTKAYKSMELLGCTIEECRKHLESQFTEGMSWNNHGEWHIDHIIPCSIFDLTDPVEQKQCFHYTNLQPLWAKDNLSKSNKIIP